MKTISLTPLQVTILAGALLSTLVDGNSDDQELVKDVMEKHGAAVLDQAAAVLRMSKELPLDQIQSSGKDAFMSIFDQLLGDAEVRA